MNAPELVSVAGYLGRIYDPDREFLEGTLVGRNSGEIDHGDARGRMLLHIRTHFSLQCWAAISVRVQVRVARYRVPDVVIMRGGKPSGRIINTPPEVAVEVLSPDDRASAIESKIADYQQFGVACVWVIDPETRPAFMHSVNSPREATDGLLRNPAGDLTVPPAAIFS